MLEVKEVRGWGTWYAVNRCAQLFTNLRLDGRNADSSVRTRCYWLEVVVTSASFREVKNVTGWRIA
jgi:hypothetical protein